MAALAPYAGHAQIVGITGSPGVGKSTSTSALVDRAARGRQAGRRARGRPVLAVLRRCPARRPGADAGPRARPRRLHPLDGLARPPRRAVLDDAAGAAGARRRRLRRDPDRDRRRRAERGRDRRRSPTPRWCCSRPGMGDGIQAAKAGILEIGDLFVVNKADRDGADQVRRDLRSMLALAERPEGAWRPPIVKTIAGKGEGLDEVVAEIDRHRAWLEPDRRAGRRRTAPGARRDRGDRRHRAARALGRRARPTPSSTTSPRPWRPADRPLRRCRRAAGLLGLRGRARDLPRQGRGRPRMRAWATPTRDPHAHAGRPATTGRGCGTPTSPRCRGIEVEPAYGTDDSEWPGEFPFTRGLYPTGYRGRTWTIRQFAGFGNAEQTNERYKMILGRGGGGLSVAFDMPTLMGRDSDDPQSARRGRPLRRRDRLGRRHGGPLRRASPRRRHHLDDDLAARPCRSSACTWSPPSARASTSACSTARCRPTSSRSTSRRRSGSSRPEPHLRLIGDLMEYCAAHIPAYKPLSVSGYHIREAGSTAAQELAFTLADGFGYVELGLSRGLDVDVFAPGLSLLLRRPRRLLRGDRQVPRRPPDLGALDARRLRRDRPRRRSGCASTPRPPVSR